MESQESAGYRRATINPYKYAARTVLDRLLWDIRPESWRSRARLRALKDKYHGRNAVILCNGPSLLKVDMLKLGGVYTFGLNKINLLFTKSDFRPNAIVAVNPYVISQNCDFYNTTKIPLFLSRAAVGSVKSRENISFLHCAEQSKLARDCSVSINEAYTVTTVALQLAFHMGFTRVAIVGCDHNFAQKGPANLAVKAEGRDPSHFDPNYFSNGQIWQLPDLLGSEYYYRMAYTMYYDSGRQLVNCTDGGALEVFPRMSLDSWLEGADGGR